MSEPAPQVVLGRGRWAWPIQLRLHGGRDGDQPRHGLLLGATGSGKTTTLRRVLDAHLDAGAGLVLIDLKASREVAAHLRRRAAENGTPFHAFTLDGDEHWDPLAGADAAEAADRLMATQRFSEPHYQAMYRRYLAAVTRALAAAGAGSTLADVVALLVPDALLAAVRALPGGADRAALEAYVEGLTGEQRRHLTGLADRFAVLLEGGAGTRLVPGPPERTLELHAALSAGAVVWAGLDAARFPDLATLVGVLLLGDLQAYTGAVEHGRRPRRHVVVAIDEFSALGAEAVGGLFARARSAWVSVLLASQEMADLRRVAPGFEDQVEGNLEWLLAGRQNVAASADRLARLAADRGQGTRAPDARALARLAPGEAVLIEFDPPRAQAVTITAPG